MPDAPRFRPERIFAALAAQDVAYIVIGGLAAVLHGSPTRTGDADICPDRDPANLRRLAAGLRQLEARIRVDAEPEGFPFTCDEHFLASMAMVNLVTPFGALDISFEPAGTEGYDDLIRNAVSLNVGGTEVQVASLDDVIRSKTAADRPKDHQTLSTLRALRDEIERRDES
ncbi:MAG TPA: hypothetical protein VMQ81_02350 [Acidimicrobiia bacterium]|nr:hypothetical protein [Acidimicrobiia bacterium]